VGLTTRLTIAMVGLVLLTALILQILAHRNLVTAILPGEFARVQFRAQQVAADIKGYVSATRAEILAARHSAAVEGLVRAHAAGGVDPLDGSTEQEWRERLEADLAADLSANPAHLQFRLIGVQEEGLEIVRVDRSGENGAIRIVPKEELQPKGDRTYFTQTIALADGQTRVSPIELNQEHGVIETPHVPVLRTSTPVFDPDGEPFGVLVINVGMQPIFDQIRTAKATNRRTYLVSDRGDFLVHPDRSREFGFDLGKPDRWQSDLPGLAEQMTTESEGVNQIRGPNGLELCAAVAPVRLAGGPLVRVIETEPLSEVMRPAEAIRRSSLLAALVACVVAIGIAIVSARSLTRPLVQMTAAVDKFAADRTMPVPTAAGGEVGALARAFERMAAEVRARRAEVERFSQRFELVVEASPCGIVMVGSDGKIELVNAEAERLFGHWRGELVGKSIEVLVPEQFREHHPELREGFMSDPEKRSMGAGRDLFGRRKDGSQFPVEIGLNPIETPNGLVVLSVITDISKRKAAEAELARWAEELERSNAELEQFAYVASHDLQEPLRMVASYTQLLADRYRGNIDEKADKYIHHIVDGAKRMQQLVNDLLAYSRVGSQGKPLRPTDSTAVLRRVLAGMQTAIKESGAEISFDGLPTVLADEMQLGQLFQNLIGNALKFRAEQPPQIRVWATDEGDRWRFSVEDNGVGIESQYAEKIFQMFQRLHERGKYEGSGIGLAISKKIVERHGGKIVLDSTPGQGTVFHFTMKAARGGEK
jgi:PAS domain S-box-containing protein